MGSYPTPKLDYKHLEVPDLYAQYNTTAREENKRAVSYATFHNATKRLKISVFVPRKDLCDICVSAKHGNSNPRDYAAHINSKIEASNEKTKDEEEASDEVSVWTMDVQAVLLCPKTQASAMYYRTKLQVHNLTFFNRRTKEGFCYTWDETDGDLSSETFAFLHHKHFSAYLDKHPEIKTLIIWSDGCGYQNRNAKVANSFMHLSKEKGVTIDQKYLTKWHT